MKIEPHNPTLTKRVALGSIWVGVVVLILKLIAWLMTGSIALYSDAMESTVNIVTAIAAYIAIRVSARPADENHPYGHNKAEYLSAVLEGVMIIIAAILIFREAWHGFMHPKVLDAPLSGILINLLAGAINGAWAYLLLKKGRELRSPALTADGHHLKTDVISSLGVALGVILALATGWWWLDPLLASFVAINILWSGWHVVRASLGGLLDEAVPVEELDAINEIIRNSAEGAIEVHDVRTRVAGAITFIDFHLVVDGEMSVTQSHRICDRIENALRAKIPDASINIHVEPANKAKHDEEALDLS